MKYTNKRFLNLLISIAILAGFLAFIGIKSKFTLYSIFPNEDEVEVPEVGLGEEVVSLGYKYSNDNDIYVSAPTHTRCFWKPDKEDDGWKNCEAIFEIDNKGEIKGFLEDPEIRFDFKNGENIRNVQIAYSSNYDVEEETIINHEEESTSTEHVEQDFSSGITGNIIEGSIGERSSQEIPPRAERVEVKKRKFSDFKPISQLRINISLANESIENESIENESIENESIENESIENESIENETISNDTINASEINATISERNDSEWIINESIDESSGNQSEGASRQEVEEVINEIDKMQEENYAGEQEEAIQDSPAEIQEKTEVSVNFEEPHEEALKELDDEGSVIQGLFISQTEKEEMEDAEFGVDVSKPFAVKINFEIQKYSAESFDFILEDELFKVSLDPEVSSCGVLNSENYVYTLTQDVSSSGECFSIEANNVTLDCQEHTINFAGNSNGFGVSVEGYDDVQIKNCNFQSLNDTLDSKQGVYAADTRGLLVQNSSFVIFGDDSSAMIDGIYLFGSDYAILSGLNAFISGYGAQAVFITEGSENATVSNSTLNASGEFAYGVYSDWSDSLSFIGNSVIVSGLNTYGLYLYHCDFPVIRENDITTYGDEGYAAMLAFSTNSIVNNNYLLNLNDYGAAIFLSDNSEHAEINYNEIYTRGFEVHGVKFDSSSYSRFNSNVVNLNGSDAVGAIFVDSDYCVVDSNGLNISGSTTAAVRLEQFSDYNNISGNIVNTFGIAGYGIDFEDSSFNNMVGNAVYTRENNSYGIRTSDSSNNSFYNNNITTVSYQSAGVYLREGSENNILSFLNIGTLGEDSAGIMIKADGNMLLNCEISTNGANSPSLKVLSNMDLDVENCLLNASYSNTGDFAVGTSVSDGFYNLTNVSFYDVVWANSSTAVLNASNYLSIFANYTNGSRAEDANVTIFSGSSLLHSFVNSSNVILLPSYHQTDFENYSHMNYTVNASSEGWNLSEYIIMDSNINLVFTFGEPADDSNITSNTSEGSVSVSSRGSAGAGGAVGGGISTSSVISEVKNAPQQKDTKVKRKTLFDVSLDLIGEEVSDTLLVRLGLINVGEPGLTEIVLDYTISDMQGNVFQEGNEKVSLETQTQFIKEFDVSGLDEGEYRLFVGLMYIGQEEPARGETNFVITREVNLSPSFSKRFRFLAIIAIVLLASIFLISKIRSGNKSKFSGGDKEVVTQDPELKSVAQ